MSVCDGDDQCGCSPSGTGSGLAGEEVLGQGGACERLAQQARDEQHRAAWPMVDYDVLGLPGGIAGNRDDDAGGARTVSPVRATPGARRRSLCLHLSPTRVTAKGKRPGMPPARRARAMRDREGVPHIASGPPPDSEEGTP